MKRSPVIAHSPPVLSLEDWASFDEDEPGELVDGFLEEEEMPTVLHEIVVLWLAALLTAWAKRRRGLVLGSEAKIAIAPRRGRKPDTSVYLPPNLPQLDDALIRVPPFLVVEVVSPRPRDARRDRVDKLRDYARARATYYWIVDPSLRTLEVFELERKRRRYVSVVAASEGRVRIPGCGRLVVDLDALWTEAGRPIASRSKKKRPR